MLPYLEVRFDADVLAIDDSCAVVDLSLLVELSLACFEFKSKEAFAPDLLTLSQMARVHHFVVLMGLFRLLGCRFLGGHDHALDGDVLGLVLLGWLLGLEHISDR